MIDHLDHIVITTDHEEACIRFYRDVLGMKFETFVGGNPPVERKAFTFGPNKINLHVKGHEFEPKAHLPVPGALDFCMIAAIPLEQVMDRLAAANVAIVEGPVLRTGATSRIRSVYVRDPDLNLIENLWAHMAREVEKHSCETMEALQDVVAAVWDKIDADDMRELVHSMPKRCQAVIDAQGWHTKY